MILFLISRKRDDNIALNIAGLYTSPVILLLISNGGENAITSNIAEGVHPLCYIVPYIQEGRGWYYFQYRRECTPPLRYCSEYPWEERVILLPISKGMYIPPVILFLNIQLGRGWYYSQHRSRCTPSVILPLLSKAGEDDITSCITWSIHPPCDIAPIIQVERGCYYAQYCKGCVKPLRYYS